MNRFGEHHNTATQRRSQRYYDDSDDDYGENSSSHSVRVSKLIEKIKNQQIHHRVNAGGPHRVPSGKDFSYFEPNHNGSRDSLIYSTIQRGGGGSSDLHKRTVRERVDVRNNNLRSDLRSSSDVRSSPLHKTTVLLNNDAPIHHHDNDTRLYSDRYVTPPRSINRPSGISSSAPPLQQQPRYFGDSEYEDYDKHNHHKYSSIRSRDDVYNSTLGRSNTFNTRSSNPTQRSAGDTLTRNSGFNTDTLSRNQNKNYDSLRSSNTNIRGSVPKIILHEQAIAEIPNGKREPRTRSPSVQRELATTDEEDGKGRFLGGFLTLKRGKNKERIRSTRSPTPRSRAGSYLNVPNASHHHHDNNDSSSSPKYYVPYRSTPTLYESKYERDRHSSNGSVLSNGSYVNKHVTRSMSVKAPWEPRHRSNEINYFNDRQFDSTGPGIQKSPSKATLSRSKSMPGKKLTSIIGSWVTSRGKKEKHNDEKPNDSERLLKDKVVKEPKPKSPGKFGSLFRFGNNSGKGKAEKSVTERSVSPDRPPRRRGVERSTPDAHGTLRRGGADRQAYGTLRSSGGSNNARFYN